MSPAQPPSIAPAFAAAPPPADVPVALQALLTQAAHLATRAGVPLDEFMRAAWSAFVDSLPGLRQRIETEQLIAQLETLRARGAVGQA